MSDEIKGRWNKLDGDRQSHLCRCRKCAELSIPSLLPPEGYDENQVLDTPWQSLGARGVNKLAAKLLITLFPPNSPFFKLSVDPMVLEELKQQIGEEGIKTQVDDRMVRIAKMVKEHIEYKSLRVPAYKTLKLLIATGNALVEVPENGDPHTVYRLDQFVTVRDPAGTVVELIVREEMAQASLTDEQREIIETNGGHIDGQKETVELFTRCIKKDKKTWEITQELGGVLLSDKTRTVKKDRFPYIVLTWSLPANANYGIGHVEEYLGDFVSLESLTASIVQGSEAAARVLFLLNPNGRTKKRDILNARNCAIITGHKDDVTTLQLEKFADFRVAKEAIGDLINRLSEAFLLHSSTTRQAERVTAAEVRYMAEELEDTLGGIYSCLSQDYQLPLVKLVMRQMTKSNELPKLPDEVRPVITTGIEALGRGHDAVKIRAFLEDAVTLGPDVAHKWIDPEDALTKLANARGVETDGLIRTREDVQAEEQAQMQQAMMAQVGPGIATQATKGVMDQMNQQQPPMEG